MGPKVLSSQEHSRDWNQIPKDSPESLTEGACLRGEKESPIEHSLSI